MIPAQRRPGERDPEPVTAPLRQATTTALFDRIPQQRRSSAYEPQTSPQRALQTAPQTSPLRSAVTQTVPNPALVARLAPRRRHPLAGVLAVLGGAALAVVAILVLIAVLGALV